VAELVPVPLGTLLRRAFYEYRERRAIFDLPERKFRRAAGPAVDLSVPYAGARAANPIGPAAGPHTQLAQNLALGWLAGARVFELKTVQINDRLTLSRPCIDMATVGYNTEWSQELRLDESLREYVKGAMIIEILGASGIVHGAASRDSELGIRESETAPSEPFVFDISVGYDLAGIQSAPIVSWIESMKNARGIIDGLRREIPDEFARFRDYPFKTDLGASVTLSTFHGTPAEEIEWIGEFLIGDLGLHTVVKLNPPMLGKERTEAILHEMLGYADITVNPDAYERELPFDEAVAVIRRLRTLGGKLGLDVGVKCGNTLEVLNAGAFLKERVQYLSGQPLHALHAALALRWREAFGGGLQISFAAGVDAQNVADCVAAGFVPVTTCTDLLRPGGYARLPRYLVNLEDRMRAAGARTIRDFVLRSAGVDAGAAGLGDDALGRAKIANGRVLVDKALSAERYRAAQNRKPPRKLGTHLWLWDCLSCSKCIPACPNDAVFEIEIDPFIGEVPVIEIDGDAWRDVDRRLYRALKPTQIVIFADACNDCGNCDVFCPEDGGPHLEKPRFFGSVDAWRRAAPLTGFVLTKEDGAFLLRGRTPDGEFVLKHAVGSDRADFEARDAVAVVDWVSHEPLAARQRGPRIPSPEPRVPIDLSTYMTFRLLMDGILRTSRVHFVNAAFVE
jgi:putative selenate reductase